MIIYEYMKKKSYIPQTKVKNPVPKKKGTDWVIWAAWADRITFEEIKEKTWNSESDVIKIMRKNLKSIFSFYRDGFLVAGLSPKSIIFFGTIFTSFIDFTLNYTAQFLILIITYVSLDFLTLMIYAFAANKVSIWLKDNPKVLNTISACVLIIIAVYVAASQTY